MALAYGSKNKNVVSDHEPQKQSELEVVHDERQTLKDAEIEALRRRWRIVDTRKFPLSSSDGKMENNPISTPIW